MDNLQKQFDSLRRWRWLVLGCGLVGLLIAALIAMSGSTTYSSTATVVVGSAATQNSSSRAPEQDAVLARGYVEMINSNDQDAIRTAADIPDNVTITAAPVANSQFIAITATGPDSEAATAAAQGFAQQFVADTYRTFNAIVTGRLAPLRARYRALTTEIANVQQQVNDASGAGAAELAGLQGQLASLRAEATGLSEQIQQQASVAGNPNLAGLYQAAGATTVSQPSVARNAVLGLVGGLILGAAAALLLGALELRIRTPADVRSRLGLNTLGAVPRGKNGTAATGHDDASRQIADALAVVRPRVATVAVTSPGEDEGASAVAGDLARRRATQGERVILIEADARRLGTPATNGAGPKRGAEREPRGLAELLDENGATPITRFLKDTANERLLVLPPGRRPADARTVLSTDRLNAIIEEAAAEADLVVIACPPLLTAAESQLLCAAADGTVLVIDAVTTPAASAVEARELLARNQTTTVGVVLNRVSATSLIH